MRINRDILLAVIVVVMIAGIGFITPAFVRPQSLVGLFNDTSILIMVALGQMTVILTKCIDLSVGANIALTGVLVALVNAAHPSALHLVPSTAPWCGWSAFRRLSSRSAHFRSTVASHSLLPGEHRSSDGR